MKYIVMVILFLNAACTTLHHEVLTKVQVGDSEENMFRALGEPDRFGPVGQYNMYIYTRRHELCQFAVQSKTIMKIACGENRPAKKNPAPEALEKLADGFKQNQTRCTSSTIGGITNTTCN